MFASSNLLGISTLFKELLERTDVTLWTLHRKYLVAKPCLFGDFLLNQLWEERYMHGPAFSAHCLLNAH